MNQKLTSAARCDRLVLRQLQGQLDSEEASELELLLARPELALQAAELKATWQSLDPPPTSTLPATFRSDLMAAVRNQQRDQAWPAWARPGLAAALLLGVTIGMAASQPNLQPISQAVVVDAGESDAGESGETFWLEPDPAASPLWWPEEGEQQ